MGRLPRGHAGGGKAGGRLTRGREGALLQIMLLASRLGWSRAEILALPLAEAQFYVDQLTKKRSGE